MKNFILSLYFTVSAVAHAECTVPVEMQIHQAPEIVTEIKKWLTEKYQKENVALSFVESLTEEMAKGHYLRFVDTCDQPANHSFTVASAYQIPGIKATATKTTTLNCSGKAEKLVDRYRSKMKNNLRNFQCKMEE